MFDPIQNGTIFDIIMAIFMGITFGSTMALVYCVIVQALGYNPLEKGVIRKMLKDALSKIVGIFKR